MTYINKYITLANLATDTRVLENGKMLSVRDAAGKNTGLVIGDGVDGVGTPLKDLPLVREGSLKVDKSRSFGTGTVSELQALTAIEYKEYYTTDIRGFWYYDNADTATVHDGFTTIVTAGGARLKRHFERKNVQFWGAKGDGVTDDTAAIQKAANSLKQGESLFFPKPKSKYKITGRIDVTGKFFFALEGDAGTEIHNPGTTSTFKFSDSEHFEIKNLRLTGNGGANGVNATNLHGIELSNSHWWKFTNVDISNNGGHGIYAYNGMWGGSSINCRIINNKQNGIEAPNTYDAALGNTFQNGNAVSLIGTTLAYNGGHGLRWSGANLNISSSCVIEGNKGVGTFIDTFDSAYSAYGVNIVGNYFENNTQGSIKLASYLASAPKNTRTVSGVNIEGNYIYSNVDGVGAADNLIHLEATGYYGAYIDVNIGINTYETVGASLTHYVKVDSSRTSVRVAIEGVVKSKFSIAGEAKILQTRRTLALSGLFNQKGLPWTLPRRSDNFLAQTTKEALFNLPVEESILMRTVSGFIETDATSYDVRIKIEYADALSATALANLAWPAAESKAGSQTFSVSVISYTSQARPLPNRTYYVTVQITNVVGGTYMYLNDIILELV